MDTHQRKIGSYRGFVLGTFVSLCLISAGATSAFADRKHGNPPGPAGGPGAGPAWRDNPNRVDNPPGPIGGRGTDYYGEGERHRAHPRARYRVATHRLERLKAKRERFAAKGAPADVLAKLDEKIAQKQVKIEEYLSKHQPPAGEEAASESGAEQE